MSDSRRSLAALLAVILMLAPFSVAFAEDTIEEGFGDDTENIYDRFCDAYDWDPEMANQESWVFDGVTYTRPNLNEKSTYDDLVNTSEGLAVDMGIIPPVRGASGSAALMISIAYAEYEAYGNVYMPINKYNTPPEVHHGYGGAWCADFISYCARHAGLTTDQGGPFLHSRGCTQIANYFINDLGFDWFWVSDASCYGGSEPVIAGDIIFWIDCEHIGLVVEVGDGYLKIIEGNHGDRLTCIAYNASNLRGNFYENGLSFNGAFIVRVIYPDSENTVYNYLHTGMKLPVAACCGVMANMNFVDNVSDMNGESVMLINWSGDVLERLKVYCASRGVGWDTVTGQLMFLKYDLETNYKDLLVEMRNVPATAEGAAKATKLFFEGYNIGRTLAAGLVSSRIYNASKRYYPKYSTM